MDSGNPYQPGREEGEGAGPSSARRVFLANGFIALLFSLTTAVLMTGMQKAVELFIAMGFFLLIVLIQSIANFVRFLLIRKRNRAKGRAHLISVFAMPLVSCGICMGGLFTGLDIKRSMESAGPEPRAWEKTAGQSGASRSRKA